MQAAAAAVRVGDTLASLIRGQVVRPQDPTYDEVRKLHNGMIDRRPALIVRCSGAADVLHCVRAARENDLPVSVRGGGHGVAGFAVCEGGLMIDLSAVRGVRVD
jgi:FAD/FMN-containing dehydrogenase